MSLMCPVFDPKMSNLILITKPDHSQALVLCDYCAVAYHAGYCQSSWFQKYKIKSLSSIGDALHKGNKKFVEAFHNLIWWTVYVKKIQFLQATECLCLVIMYTHGMLPEMYKPFKEYYVNAGRSRFTVHKLKSSFWSINIPSWIEHWERCLYSEQSI